MPTEEADVMSTGWPSKPKPDDSSGTANEIREYSSSQDSPENLDRSLLRSEYSLSI